MDVTAPPAEPASRAADYRKVRVLGKGSFGVASLCTREKDGQLCVIKAINLSALSARDLANVEKEVAILQTLDHPNVVKYHDSFTEQQVLCIVTEFADGGDLGQRIKDYRSRGQLIAEELILSWAIQLVLALKYLHDQKILHRDLKPANIFLTSRNTVKLGDFGVSTVLQASVNFAETFCGTPYYLSPEVCEEQPYNNKADMWALGCCLYECMALRRPFEGKNILQLADKICRAAYAPLPETYSQDLRSFVELLLQRLPIVRPNVRRLLKLPLMQRNLRLLGDDLLDAEKYQRALGTANLAKARPGSRRMTAEQREAAEKDMLEWLNKDKERLAAEERREQEARDAFLRHRAVTYSGGSMSPQKAAAAAAAASSPPANRTCDGDLRGQVRDLLARREEALKEDGDGSECERRASEDLRAMQSLIDVALVDDGCHSSEATEPPDADFTDQSCVFAELLRSRSHLPPE
eukprot:TRINITY_DN4025_c0_g1_i1.p1 TRINITY_DN4025_c0_g1~~TRINITY_DN4025_c0_g1_i1.p1  ORF type:complete len:466 (+),score=177.15 TRINITY_DN4025_c0_g1_i1:75-1472(+)